MKYKEIVFDFDGTIVDSVSTLIDWLMAGGTDLDLSNYDKDDLKRFRGMSPEALMKELKLSRIRLVKYAKKFQSYILQQPQKLKVIDGMPAVINDLSQDHSIGVLSSNSRNVIEKVLKLNDLNHFEYIRSGATLWSKEKKIKDLLKERGLKKDEVIYIGDEVKDADAAKKVGIDIISVTWGYNDEKILQSVNPGRVVELPSQIVEFVRSDEK